MIAQTVGGRRKNVIVMCESGVSSQNTLLRIEGGREFRWTGKGKSSLDEKVKAGGLRRSSVEGQSGGITGAEPLGKGNREGGKTCLFSGGGDSYFL